MITAMDSGVLGMMAHQQRMDVIGNDIANINTVGYKHSNVSFQETFVQSLRAPVNGLQGMQKGLGVQMSQISRSFEPGGFTNSGVPNHLAIFGNGFFVVGPERMLTRAGDFQVEAADGGAFLITPTGLRLQGVMGDGDLPGDVDGLEDINLREGLGDEQIISSVDIGLDGVVRRTVDGGEPEVVGRVALAMVDNPTGLEAIGGNLYRQTEAAMLRGVMAPGENGAGDLYQGFTENSNVDLAREFTEMITTQRGFQANSRIVTTSDDMLQEALAMKR